MQNILSAVRRDPGRRVLVTAGPTREPIDPVRFISNRSSGKMGLALAEAAREPYLFGISQAIDANVDKILATYAAITERAYGRAAEWPAGLAPSALAPAGAGVTP